MKKIKKFLALTLLATLFTGCGKTNVLDQEPKKETKVDFILDWVPNTNHTGLYVAKKMGFDKEFGINLDIKRPPEGSTSELISSGHANFGISFQDSLAKKFEKGINLTVLGTIINNNTSGIISKKSLNIHSPKDLDNHSYGTWDDPIEKSIIAEIMKKDGGDFNKLKLVPNNADNSVVGIANNMFDSAWVYYAWDVILANNNHVDNNFFYIKDYSPELNFYSPVIIANSDFVNNHKDITKSVMAAIKKGYQYAISHPEEAANILIENAPELSDKKDFVIESQKWISKEYASSPEKWGYIDKNRWDAFYKYLYENKLISVDLTQKTLFTNDFLGE